MSPQTESTSFVKSSLDERRRRWHPADLAPFVSLAAITLFFVLTVDDFLNVGTLNLVLTQGAVLAIVSVGLTYVLLCAEIDLSVGTIALLSACLCGVLYEQPFAAGPGGAGEASPAALAVVLAAPFLAALVLGLISGLLTVSSGLPSFIITLAMMNIATGLSKYLTQSQKFDVPDFLKTIGNGEFRLIGDFDCPDIAVLAAVVLLIGHVVLRHTRFGRYVYMTGGNREAARLAGIRTNRIVIASLAICAVTAALGGLINAGRLESVSLDQNADLLLDAVACVVLGGTSLFGGVGGMGRTLIGVVTFTVLKVGLSLMSIEWIVNFDLLRPFLMGVVLMVALVINGVLSRRRD